MLTYAETLDYLYAQLPMFHRIGPAAFKKDLGNTLALCEHLGNPHRTFKSIHIAGTNGKGSVSHMLAAVCQSAGLKTGLYISPHYKDFRERIKIDGTYISRRRVVEFVGKNRDAIERIKPSFFELCVAMAFDHFAREKVDIAVIEVGLGGRLDSTNVITPLLSVITNISFDHQNMLGDTLPQIASEKAGIIKPGIPIIVGETHPESAPVFLEKAASVDAPILFADQHLEVRELPESDIQHTVFDVLHEGRPVLSALQVDAAGPYQGKNVVTAIQAAERLFQTNRDLLRKAGPKADTAEISLAGPPLQQIVRHGLGNLCRLTRFMGRWQVIGSHPTILCDSAHNEAGLRAAFKAVAEIPHNRLHIVTGFVNDKDVEKVLPLFPAGARYYFAKANIPRGLDAAILREKAASFGLQGRAYRSVRHALRAARIAAQADDLIMVTGSIFVVAEVL
ncbi:MAG: Mur ligase family protein [Saprospiraceae bacterium]|nr:Mur ligase family protein [Saprospiraceae bacterium]HNL39857.1 Mur ligase family protein [Saprospiraceae bacterium]